jgi:hypothetical protein
MKFHLNNTLFISWNGGVDVHSEREWLIGEYAKLMAILEAEIKKLRTAGLAPSVDHGEKYFIDARIKELRECARVNPLSPPAEKLASEFLKACTLNEELDRLKPMEAIEVMRGIVKRAKECIIIERKI